MPNMNDEGSKWRSVVQEPFVLSMTRQTIRAHDYVACEVPLHSFCTYGEIYYVLAIDIEGDRILVKSDSGPTQLLKANRFLRVAQIN